MRLRRIKITQLPGIRDGFTLDDFGAGVNVITGPNASGKSSLVRALRHLIDETSEPSGGALTLEAELASGEDTWTVTRSGTLVVWQRNGQPVERPPLPRGDFLHCYWLSMDDLLEQGGTETAIAVKLRRELSGGFDLAAVRRSVFHVGPKYGESQQKALQKKNEELRNVTQRYKSLDRERPRLPELDEEISVARAAETRATNVERALEWLAARRSRLAAEEQLDKFPAGMEFLSGRERERLEELEKRREQLLGDRREADLQLTEARTELEKTGQAENPPEAADLDARRQDLADARDHNTRLVQQREQLDDARGREETAAEALRPLDDRVLKIDPGTVDSAVRMAEDLRDVERSIQELKKAADTEPPASDKLTAYETMTKELRRWLRQLDPARHSRLAVGGIAVLVFAVMAAVAAWLADATVAALLSAGAIVAAGWVMWQLVAVRNQRNEAERRAVEVAAEQAAKQPEDWTAAAVERRLRELDTELAELRLEDEKARESARSRKEMEGLGGRLEELQREKSDLALEIGFDPSMTGESVARFYHLVLKVDEARAARIGLEKKVVRESEEIEFRLRRVADYLARHGIRIEEDARDLSTLTAQFEALQTRVKALHEAQRGITQAERELKRLDGELEEVDRSLQRLFHDIGLELDDRKGLLERCDRYEEYRGEQEAQKKAAAEEAVHKRDLQEDQELIELIENDDEAGLRRLLEELRAKAERSDKLQQDRAEIQARLDNAGEDQALEKARLELDRARDALHDVHEAAMLADAGQFMLDEVAEEHRLEHEPEVVAAARDRFGRYTHNRYRLFVGEDGSIRARDTEQEIDQSPETLSTGTRIQLFMAVRLAWTSVLEEEGEPLPIFLDESLTTTDPERFDSIARNLKDIAEREGRQIFYLTAQPSDALRWEKAIGESPHHVDLPRLRFGADHYEPADYRVDEPEPIPEPGGMSAEEYAAYLGVPAVNPHRGAGAIHIFHLLRDDLSLLHYLMEQRRSTRLGHLERLLESEAAGDAVADAEVRERMKGRCLVARTWVELWRRGRGRPVDRNALEASGAVSGTFIGRVTELTESQGGDAETLIEALRGGEVSGFRQNKTEELADRLEEQGYLDQRESLSSEERERGLLQQAGNHASSEEIRWINQSLDGGCQL